MGNRCGNLLGSEAIMMIWSTSFLPSRRCPRRQWWSPRVAADRRNHALRPRWLTSSSSSHTRGGTRSATACSHSSTSPPTPSPAPPRRRLLPSSPSPTLRSRSSRPRPRSLPPRQPRTLPLGTNPHCHDGLSSRCRRGSGRGRICGT